MAYVCRRFFNIGQLYGCDNFRFIAATVCHSLCRSHCVTFTPCQILDAYGRLLVCRNLLWPIGPYPVLFYQDCNRVFEKRFLSSSIVDVSHASEKTFYGIVETATKPLLASHSNAYALCPAKRNLKDEQIKIIASTGGVIGMNAWPAFIDEKTPSAEKLADHVDYMVDLVGIDHVGCGFDFCDFLDDNALSFAESGQVSTKDLEDATKVRNFTDILKRRGYDEEALEKIMYKNMERLLYKTL